LNRKSAAAEGENSPTNKGMRDALKKGKTGKGAPGEEARENDDGGPMEDETMMTGGRGTVTTYGGTAMGGRGK